MIKPNDESHQSQQTDFLTPEQCDFFNENGYLVLPNRVEERLKTALLEEAKRQLIMPAEPVEYEAQVGYEGAPSSMQAEGGKTVRRLLDAYGRHALYQKWSKAPFIRNAMQQLLGGSVFLVRNHHNCIMTKHPQYGTATGWHRDIRYWSFTNHELISVWLALGDETESNGALRVIPGSHRWNLDSRCMDERQFLLPEKATALGFDLTQTVVNLQAGDVLLFHAKTLHAAGKNISQAIKFSLVFTYRNETTLAIEGTRSARQEDLSV